jgi:membrane fusion protein (multidrug efflux system)
VVIRAQVRNQDTTLRPGMFARVRLITRERAEAMVLPEQALVPQGTEQYVFKVADGKVVRVKIETGQRRDSKVEVISGLAPGDMVVTAGQLKLRDGATVKIAASEEDKARSAAQGKSSTAASGDAGGNPIAPSTVAPVKAEGASARPPKT